MTKDIMEYIPSIVKKYNITGRTLDIGAMDINGCLREFFKDYTGLDMTAGDNVDVVCSSHRIPFDFGLFDCVVTVDMLEHDPDPFKSAKEMMRVLKKGGIAIVVAPFQWPVHDFPDDYFRYTPNGLKELFKGMECLESELVNNHARVVLRKI